MKGASIDWHQHLVERRRSHEAVELKKCFVLVSMGGGRSIFTMPDTFSTDSSELDGLTDGTDGGLDNLSMGVAGLLFALTNQNMSNLVLLQIAARHEEFLNNSKPPFCKYKQPASLTKRLPESNFFGI